jgi:hypothetical protein
MTLMTHRMRLTRCKGGGPPLLNSLHHIQPHDGHNKAANERFHGRSDIERISSANLPR